MAQEASNIPQNIYPVRVQVVGASGEQITSFGGSAGAGYALDATLTDGTQQTKITDGTNIANILKSDGTAIGQNAQLIGGAHLPVAFTTTSAQAVGTTDAANYSWVSVHVVTQGGSSTVNFQGSNDNTNWVAVSLTGAASAYASSSSTTTAGVIFSGPLNYRYFRLNVTGIASGTTAGTIEFFSVGRTPSVYPVASSSANTAAVPVSQSGTWTVGSNSATGSAVPANAIYIGANDLSTGNLVGIRTLTNAYNSGAGALAAGITAVFDDVSPTVITENNFGAVRMGTAHQLLVERTTDYPYSATAITAASGNVANASAAATLAGVASKTTYITGFECTGSGSTAGSVVSVTVTGTVTGTLTYTFAAPTGVLSSGTPLIVSFPAPIPASAANTAIVVTLPALGTGNTNATTVAHGYQL